MKPNFMKNQDPQRVSQASHRANIASSSSINSHDSFQQFTTNPTALLNKFVAYLQKKKGREEIDQTVNTEDRNSTALLGKFVGFMVEAEHIPQQDYQGILKAFKTALNVHLLHDFWVVDSGASGHMTNKD